MRHKEFIELLSPPVEPLVAYTEPVSTSLLFVVEDLTYFPAIEMMPIEDCDLQYYFLAPMEMLMECDEDLFHKCNDPPEIMEKLPLSDKCFAFENIIPQVYHVEDKSWFHSK